MDTARLPYEPGSLAPAGSGPLARYLPPLPPGMVSGWLRRQAPERVPPGVWLFDPLGASPAMVLEAALAGYRVLVACNNPILSFMIETLASAPDSGDFQSVLAALAASRRGEERLDAPAAQSREPALCPHLSLPALPRRGRSAGPARRDARRPGTAVAHGRRPPAACAGRAAGYSQR